MRLLPFQPSRAALLVINLCTARQPSKAKRAAPPAAVARSAKLPEGEALHRAARRRCEGSARGAAGCLGLAGWLWWCLLDRRGRWQRCACSREMLSVRRVLWRRSVCTRGPGTRSSPLACGRPDASLSLGREQSPRAKPSSSALRVQRIAAIDRSGLGRMQPTPVSADGPPPATPMHSRRHPPSRGMYVQYEYVLAKTLAPTGMNRQRQAGYRPGAQARRGRLQPGASTPGRGRLFRSHTSAPYEDLPFRQARGEAWRPHWLAAGGSNL